MPGRCGGQQIVLGVDHIGRGNSAKRDGCREQAVEGRFVLAKQRRFLLDFVSDPSHVGADDLSAFLHIGLSDLDRVGHNAFDGGREKGAEGAVDGDRGRDGQEHGREQRHKAEHASDLEMKACACCLPLARLEQLHDLKAGNAGYGEHEGRTYSERAEHYIVRGKQRRKIIQNQESCDARKHCAGNNGKAQPETRFFPERPYERGSGDGAASVAQAPWHGLEPRPAENPPGCPRSRTLRHGGAVLCLHKPHMQSLRQAFCALSIEVVQAASPLLPNRISGCRVWENCGAGTTIPVRSVSKVLRMTRSAALARNFVCFCRTEVFRLFRTPVAQRHACLFIRNPMNRQGSARAQARDVFPAAHNFAMTRHTLQGTAHVTAH